MKLPFPLSLSSKKDLKNNFSEKFKDLNSQTKFQRFKSQWQKILLSVLDEKLSKRRSNCFAEKRKKTRIIWYGIQNFEFVAYVIKKNAATDLTFICCSVDHPITFIQKVAKVRSILFYFYPLRSCP